MYLSQHRLNKAIAVMQRVVDRGSQVNMLHWQNPRMGEVRTHACATEEEIHNCGTAACFGGWLAVSPEWKEDGGRMDSCGGPRYGERGFSEFGSEAIAQWLGIPSWKAQQLTCIELGPDRISSLYGKAVVDITAQDVIDKLKELQE